ncbi:hypothetical protein JW978_01995 [Candidatus Dojkabacteria bacterium]|nr:hypothetical protein [Candidatus Dojkabacteria bacterium]
MSTIRLTLNDKTEQVVSVLEKRYEPMSRAEILKLGLSTLYNRPEEGRYIEVLDDETSQNVEDAIQELESGKGKSFSSVTDLVKDLEE